MSSAAKQFGRNIFGWAGSTGLDRVDPTGQHRFEPKKLLVGHVVVGLCERELEVTVGQARERRR